MLHKGPHTRASKLASDLRSGITRAYLLEWARGLRYADFADADVDCRLVLYSVAERKGKKIWRRGLIGEPKMRNSKTIFDDPMDRMN